MKLKNIYISNIDGKKDQFFPISKINILDTGKKCILIDTLEQMLKGMQYANTLYLGQTNKHTMNLQQICSNYEIGKDNNFTIGCVFTEKKSSVIIKNFIDLNYSKAKPAYATIDIIINGKYQNFLKLISNDYKIPHGDMSIKTVKNEGVADNYLNIRCSNGMSLKNGIDLVINHNFMLKDDNEFDNGNAIDQINSTISKIPILKQIFNLNQHPMNEKSKFEFLKKHTYVLSRAAMCCEKAKLCDNIELDKKKFFINIKDNYIPIENCDQSSKIAIQSMIDLAYSQSQGNTDIVLIKNLYENISKEAQIEITQMLVDGKSSVILKNPSKEIINQFKKEIKNENLLTNQLSSIKLNKDNKIFKKDTRSGGR